MVRWPITNIKEEVRRECGLWLQWVRVGNLVCAGWAISDFKKKWSETKEETVLTSCKPGHRLRSLWPCRCHSIKHAIIRDFLTVNRLSLFCAFCYCWAVLKPSTYIEDSMALLFHVHVLPNHAAAANGSKRRRGEGGNQAIVYVQYTLPCANWCLMWWTGGLGFLVGIKGCLPDSRLRAAQGCSCCCGCGCT